MKNLWKIAQPLGLLCFLGAFILAALNALAIMAASVGVLRLFNFFQYLRVPYWSVALSAAGILIFPPLALRQAFTYEPEAKEKKVVEPSDWRRVVEEWRNRLRLRHA